MNENLYIKQAEVHGMSQRGGDVQSNLRISSEPIASDLIAKGAADVIISMEPMEALRYLPYLSVGGRIVTASKPLVNIPDYPEMEAVDAELSALPVTKLDIEAVALEHKIPRGANMILLGMTAPFLGILPPQALREAVARVFAPKGEAVVEADLKAFDLGLEAAGQ